MERINSYCENCQITITSHVFHNLLKYFLSVKEEKMVEIQLLLLALCLSIGARLCASSCASVCVDKVSGVNRPNIHTTTARTVLEQECT